MKRLLVILILLICVSAYAQKSIRIYSTYAENYAAMQLQTYLEKAGCRTTFGGKRPTHTIYVGVPPYMKYKYKALTDSLKEDGYFIWGDGRDIVIHGKGSKGTLYGVYSFLEQLGFRLYTPSSLIVPDFSLIFPYSVFNLQLISNPAFAWREVSYYYPNHSQLYADWHHLHTVADRNSDWGMFVHTFQRLIPPSSYYDNHPEWFSLNNGRRLRDGQLCLSNSEVFEELCMRLADTMAAFPQKTIWSVSPNDNYNACECDNCKRLDSIYGGPSGTLLWFVNRVARRFPDKTIATLAYQYTRNAPVSDIKPDTNVLIMLCPIEAGREKPIEQSDPAFSKDMENWSRITDNLFIWDYVVQFRNFWNPFPNLHVLQPNMKFFREHGARMMFEQASGANNITSWMDIRCYMIAKLLWNPDVNIDSVMSDFYMGYYGGAGPYVKEIIDTMTTALLQSGKRLDIYGYPIDGADGYLSVARYHQYDSLMKMAWKKAPEHYEGCFKVPDSALLFFNMALDFARNELAVSRDLCGYLRIDSIPVDITPIIERLEHFCSYAYLFGVEQMMEMGLSPDKYVRTWSDNLLKRFGNNRARHKAVTLRHNASEPYNTAGLTDGKAGILDYRHDWLGFWGDTLDAIIDLGDTALINSVTIDFYYYPLSWIFLPQNIFILYSDDGANWYRLAVWHDIADPEVLATPMIKKFTFNSYDWHEWHEARYIRIIANPLPEIPSWHRASGQKPWIFIDEIIIK